MFRKIKIIVLSSLSTLILSSCYQAGLFIANLPQKFHDYNVIKDISYGEEKLQKFDIYLNSKPNAPTLIYFYGGGYTQGSKEDYKFMADAWLKRGYNVAIPDYRKYPDVEFKDIVADAAKAINYIHQNIQDYNGNKSNIYVLGHSAGAHISFLAIADRSYEVKQNPVKAIAGLAGPYSFEPKISKYKEIFGPPEKYPMMQVDNFITGDEPPMLLINGGSDNLVGVSNTARLAKKLDQFDVEYQRKVYEGIGHLGLVGRFADLWLSENVIIDDVDEFFKNYLDNFDNAG